MRLTILAAILSMGLWQGGAKPVPTYDVLFVLPGDNPQYTGSTTFATDAKGVVTGTMKIDVPATVTATLAGVVKDGVWTFEYPYEIPDQGCTGTVSGSAKVPANRKLISGQATIAGACSPEPMSATFSFTLREK